MRIIITGGTGFIGAVLTKRAMDLGHTAVAIDSGERGLNAVPYLRHDCRGGLLEMGPVDAVVHLAAGTGSLDRPLEELRALNVGMTQAVYESAKRIGAKAFVFPTTSLALGVPDSPYVVSKEEGMKWLLAQGDERIIPLRFFNVLGAYKGLTERRKNEVHILPTLVACYRTRVPFVINGVDYDTEDGTPGRDFVNVVDVADYILALVQRAVDRTDHGPNPAADGAIWCGTGYVTTTAQVVRIFEELFGSVRLGRGVRRAFDVGSLHCNAWQAQQMSRVLRRPLVPAWVSIRDEAEALLNGPAT